MHYFTPNPSVADLRSLSENELIILHPETPLQIAMDFARALPINRVLYIVPNTSPGLSAAVARVIAPGVNLMLDAQMRLEESQAIVRNLNRGGALVLPAPMPASVKQAIVTALPMGTCIGLDPSMPISELSPFIKSIPAYIQLIVSPEMPSASIKSMVQAMKSGQFVDFGVGTAESKMQFAAQNLPAKTALMYHPGMPLTVISALRKGLNLILLNLGSEAEARAVARHIPAGVTTNISIQHTPALMRAIASELQPGIILQIDRNVSIDNILNVCRALPAGTFLELGAWLNLTNALRVVQALNRGVHYIFPTHFSFEIRAEFISQVQEKNTAILMSFFSPAEASKSRTLINNQDLTSIYSFFDYELSESGSFYSGFNELDETLKLPLLDYLLEKNSNSSHPLDPILEETAAALDGGYAIFNDINVAIKKIKPSLNIPEETMGTIKSKIILKLEDFQKSIEDRVISSFGIL